MTRWRRKKINLQVAFYISLSVRRVPTTQKGGAICCNNQPRMFFLTNEIYFLISSEQPVAVQQTGKMGEHVSGTFQIRTKDPRRYSNFIKSTAAAVGDYSLSLYRDGVRRWTIVWSIWRRWRKKPSNAFVSTSEHRKDKIK